MQLISEQSHLRKALKRRVVSEWIGLPNLATSVAFWASWLDTSEVVIAIEDTDKNERTGRVLTFNFFHENGCCAVFP